MYINNDLLSLELARDRASGRLSRRPPGFDTKTALARLEQRMTERIDSLASSLSTPNTPVSLFSVPEVADMLGVSERTIETLIANRELVPFYIRSVRRISKESIEAYLNSTAGVRRN